MCSAAGVETRTGKPIDAKGELPDGTTFEGPDQLKAALLAEEGLVRPELHEQGARICARPRPDIAGFLHSG